eukprot:14410417-Alexandrium_andersonii.AAC.1
MSAEQSHGGNCDAEALYKALKVAFSPGALQQCQTTEPPQNMLLMIGVDANCQQISRKHLKDYKDVLLALVPAFPEIPSLPVCRKAFELLDQDSGSATWTTLLGQE